jgi:hypothetical protein
MKPHQKYIVTAHNPDTGEAEWEAFSGRNALDAAQYRAAGWAETYSHVFIRECSEVIHSTIDNADRRLLNPR